MSKVRNISGGPLDVPLLNRQVQDREVVSVPDFQPAHTDEEPLPIVWPPDKWEPVTVTIAGEHGPELIDIPSADEEGAV